MGKEKGGFLTPKAIANRIKAKGLQKLRWYCQMCEKQCRDENGFKCHCMSESHQRQMQMFSENSGAFMDGFSKEFEEGMLEIVARKAKGQRASANQIYKEYIAFKTHFHMNATVWETLTDFIMYLGRTGKCEVDETEKGWFLTYIDRDPVKLREARAAAAALGLTLTLTTLALNLTLTLALTTLTLTLTLTRRRSAPRGSVRSSTATSATSRRWTRWSRWLGRTSNPNPHPHPHPSPNPNPQPHPHLSPSPQPSQGGAAGRHGRGACGDRHGARGGGGAARLWLLQRCGEQA